MTKDPIYFRRSVIQQILYSLTFLLGALASFQFAPLSRLLNIEISQSLALSSVILCFIIISFGIGAFAGARLFNRSKNVFRMLNRSFFYIGFFAIFFFISLPLFNKLNISIYLSSPDNLFLQRLFEFFIVLVSILLPAVLVGFCLLLLFQIQTQSEAQYPRSLATLFALFLFGTAGGWFVAEFGIIPVFGISQAYIFSSVAFIGLGILIRVILSTTDTNLLKEDDGSAHQLGLFADDQLEVFPTLKNSTFISFGIISFLYFSYLILASRISCFVVSNDIYTSISIIIASFFGLAVGSLISYKLIPRQIMLYPVYTLIPVFMGIFVFFILLLAPQMKNIHLWLCSLMALENIWSCKILTLIFHHFLFYFIPAVLMGLAIIFIHKIALKNFHERMKNFSFYLLIFSLSGASGLTITTYLLISYFGLQKSLIFIMWLNFLFGLLIIFFYSIQYYKLKRTSITFFVVACFFIISLFFPGTMLQKIYENKRAGSVLVFAKETPHSTITIKTNKNTKQLTLSNNGNLIAENPLRDFYVESISSYLPLLFFHSSPDPILVFGPENGRLINNISNFRVNGINFVYNSRHVNEALTLFRGDNDQRKKSPKISLIYQDPRKVLSDSTHKYNIIIGSCCHPGFNGGNYFFSRDFYQSCRTSLTDSGLIALPLPIHGVSIEDFKIGLKTFYSVFPNTAVFYNNNLLNKYILAVGFLSDTLKFDYQKIAQHIEADSANPYLKNDGLNNIFEILNCFIMGPREIRQLTSGVRINTENKPVLLYSTPRAGDTSLNMSQILYLFRSYREPIFPYLTGMELEIEARAHIKHTMDRYQKSSDFVLSGLIAQLNGNEYRKLQLFKQAYTLNREDFGAKNYIDKYYNRFLISSPESVVDFAENAKIYFQKTEYEQAIEELQNTAKQKKCISIHSNYSLT
ncbi:hypothetical protein B6I21_01975 [candidate division KSB1 bacterium 4572_119]|nr:MAG: hypothetical protein B6I21_01975 [candidate division KSB1 bacterium 4572_119]